VDCVSAYKAAAVLGCPTRCGWIRNRATRDKIFEEFGARIFVDPKSFLYLNGTTLEYEDTLMRQGFVFQNPNAARNCGCGSSFTA